MNNNNDFYNCSILLETMMIGFKNILSPRDATFNFKDKELKIEGIFDAKIHISENQGEYTLSVNISNSNFSSKGEMLRIIHAGVCPIVSGYSILPREIADDITNQINRGKTTASHSFKVDPLDFVSIQSALKNHKKRQDIAIRGLIRSL